MDRFRVVDVTLSLDTNAYTAGDVLAATQEIANAFFDKDRGGVLESLVVHDADDNAAAFDIYLLDANVSVGAENGAPDVTDANALNILAIIPIASADYKDLGGARVAAYSGLNRVLKPASGGRSLYVAAVNGAGTPTFSAAGLKLRLGIRS